jgi:hypothetical protein
LLKISADALRGIAPRTSDHQHWSAASFAIIAASFAILAISGCFQSSG